MPEISSHTQEPELGATEAQEHRNWSSKPSSGQKKTACLFLTGIAAYLYLSLFRIPGTPFLLGGDQAFFWLNGLRLLQHELVYRDFYQFTPPGTNLVYFGLFRLFGPNMLAINLLILLLGIALCWMFFCVAGKIMRRAFSIPAAAFFLVLIYCKLLNGTHHWFSLLCVMASVFVAMHGIRWQTMLGSGALLGLASFFTQTHGAVGLTAFTIFLLWHTWLNKTAWQTCLANCCLLFAGAAAAWSLVNAHYLATIGLRPILYYQIVHAQRYMKMPAGSPVLGLPLAPGMHHLMALASSLLVYALVPATYLAAFWRCWRDRSLSPKIRERVVLLALVGSLLMLEVALRLNWLRLYTVSMPAFILLGWMISRLSLGWRRLMPMLWTILILLAALQTFERYSHQRLVINLPGGKVATGPDQYAKLDWFQKHTHPGDYFFEQNWPGYYLPLALRPSSRLATISPIDAPPLPMALSLPKELEEKQVRFILAPPLNLPAFESEGPYADIYLPPFQRYLDSCYAPVHVFADGERVLERKKTPCL